MDARAYWSPPGCGFTMHFDARHALVFQLEGCKRWRVQIKAAVRRPPGNAVADLLKAKFVGEHCGEKELELAVPLVEEMESATLRPGDLMLLPAGCWHDAEAVTASLALNLSFSY